MTPGRPSPRSAALRRAAPTRAFARHGGRQRGADSSPLLFAEIRPSLARRNPEDFQRALREGAAEPIHLIGPVQRHAGLLVLQPAGERVVLQASRNIAELAGLPFSVVMGQPLSAALGEATTGGDARAKPGPAGDRPAASHRRWRRRPADRPLYGSDGLHVPGLAHSDRPELHGRLSDLLRQTLESRMAMDLIDGRGACFAGAAKMVREPTGCDTVGVSRACTTMNGEVAAQARAPHAHDCLGRRFPAADIPPPARRPHTINRVRAIADTEAARAPVFDVILMDLRMP